MSRNPEYQYFLDSIHGRISDELPADQETEATSQEIGWWKQHQFRRAINHFRYNNITPEEDSYLKRHWDDYPVKPRTSEDPTLI